MIHRQCHTHSGTSLNPDTLEKEESFLISGVVMCNILFIKGVLTIYSHLHMHTHTQANILLCCSKTTQAKDPHPRPRTPHPSPMTPHLRPITPHPSPMTPHPSPTHHTWARMVEERLEAMKSPLASSPDTSPSLSLSIPSKYLSYFALAS